MGREALGASRRAGAHSGGAQKVGRAPVEAAVDDEQAEEHGGDGISYSTLKNLDAALEDDAQLTNRSAEDLRWKARNMKVTLLVGLGSQESLPPNWEFVMLDKKAMDKLRQKGVAYTQDRQRGVMYA